MRLLSRLFAGPPQTEAVERARRIWSQARAPDLHVPLSQLRCVVVDTETSGLDPQRAALISIGACAVEGGAVAVTSGFDVLLTQVQASDAANVLVHGIGHAAQSAGERAETALLAYLEFAQRDPLIGYHTLFDVRLLQRALHHNLAVRYRPHHLDLALLLPALLDMPDAARWTLDQWLGHFALESIARHSAISDAFATAQLWLLASTRARAKAHDSLERLLWLQQRILDASTGRS